MKWWRRHTSRPRFRWSGWSDDGVLLSLTYIKEQQIVGWARHDTRGKVESICCVPEGGEDFLYMVVRRKIDGIWQRYVERLESRALTDSLRPWHVDSAVPFDGRRQVEQAGLFIRSDTDSWTEDTVLYITFDGARPGVLGDEMLVEVETTEFSLDEGREVTTTASHRLIRASDNPAGFGYYPVGDLPEAFRNVRIYNWTARFDTFSGLDHLEGLEVVGVGDGFVLPPRTVAGGSVTYDRRYGVGVIGLPYYSDMCTLDVNVIGGESVRSKQKLVNRVSLLVDTTRNVKAGRDATALEE